MSEARALTNFSGNAVATLLIGKWVGEFDRDQAKLVLDGGDPFDEATMIDDDEAPQLAERPLPGHERPGGAGGRARRRSAQRASRPTPGRGTIRRWSPAPTIRCPDTARDTTMTESPQMPEGNYELVRTDDGGYTARISARGMLRAGDADDQPGDGVHAEPSAGSWG